MPVTVNHCDRRGSSQSDKLSHSLRGDQTTSGLTAAKGLGNGAGAPGLNQGTKRSQGMPKVVVQGHNPMVKNRENTKGAQAMRMMAGFSEMRCI